MASGRRTGQTFKRLMELQQQARLLIEVEGKPQREVAKLIDITESTLSEWVSKFKWMSLRKTELLILQEKCRHLIEADGLSVREASQITNVSQPTISTWVANLKWGRVDILAIKRNDAKRLLLEHGFNQKEVSEMVEVSEKTMGTWVKKYKWKADKNKREEQNKTLRDFASGFKEYVTVMIMAPREVENIWLLVDGYVNSQDT